MSFPQQRGREGSDETSIPSSVVIGGWSHLRHAARGTARLCFPSSHQETKFVWVVNNIAFAFGVLFQFSLKTGEDVCQSTLRTYCVPSEVHGAGTTLPSETLLEQDSGDCCSQARPRGRLGAHWWDDSLGVQCRRSHLHRDLYFRALEDYSTFAFIKLAQCGQCCKGRVVLSGTTAESSLDPASRPAGSEAIWKLSNWVPSSLSPPF